MNEQKTKLCVRKQCDRAIYSRGVCFSCYTTLSRVVRAGKGTWELFIAQGQCLEKGIVFPPTYISKNPGKYDHLFEEDRKAEGKSYDEYLKLQKLRSKK